MKSHSNNINEVWWGIAVQLCPPIQHNGQWISVVNQLYQEFGSAIVLASLHSLYANKNVALMEYPIESFTKYLYAICSSKLQEQKLSARQEAMHHSPSYLLL